MRGHYFRKSTLRIPCLALLSSLADLPLDPRVDF